MKTIKIALITCLLQCAAQGAIQKILNCTEDSGAYTLKITLNTDDSQMTARLLGKTHDGGSLDHSVIVVMVQNPNELIFTDKATGGKDFTLRSTAFALPAKISMKLDATVPVESSAQILSDALACSMR